MKILGRLRPDGRHVLVIACAAVLAVGITSIATGAAGDFVRVGKRNFAPGTTAIVGGTTAGRILVSPPSGKGPSDVSPFTTNATGVATGLNADRVDGQDATDIVAAAKPPFASVNSNGTVANSRGVAQSNAVQHTGTGTYTVTFATDVSKCAYSATETTTTDGGAAAAAPASGNNNAVQVVTRSGGGADGTEPTAPADRPFHLVVNC